MARPHRLQAEHCFYHITSRGDDRKPIYKTDRDHEKFLEYLVKAKDKFGYYLHAYCLMTNHYHLLIETTLANLSRLMQYVNTAYTAYYNAKTGRSGHLFQGRYKSILVEQETYYDGLTSYIHLNPVKAKIVSHPSEYPWSSYNAYVGTVNDENVDLARVKECLSFDLKNYGKFVEDHINDPDPFKNIYAGSLLGCEKFIKENLDNLRVHIESKDIAHKRAIRSIVDPEQIINVVAGYYKLDPVELIRSVKRPMTAKKAAIYFLRCKTGLTNNQIGELFKMKYSAVSKAAAKFEAEIKQDKRLAKEVDAIRDVLSSRFEV